MILVFFVLICYSICREEQLSQGTLSRWTLSRGISLRGTLSRGTLSRGNLLRGTLSRDTLEGHRYIMVLGQYRAVVAGIWWYWVSMGQYWLVHRDTGSVILTQYNLVLFRIKWYWVDKGLLCLYILKKLMVTSTNQPTNRPTNQQGEYRAICLFEC